MPTELEVTLKNGTKELHYIPLRIMRGNKVQEYSGKRIIEGDWPWTYPGFIVNLDIPISEIESLELDPSRRTADIDRSNQFVKPNGQIYYNWKANQ